MAAVSLLDVTREVKLDHDNVRELFDRYQKATDPASKKAIANTLIREMAIHSDAEEVSVYNNYQSVGLGGMVSHNKEDHAEVKNLVYDAERTSMSSESYDGILARAVQAFDEHAKEEEINQHPMLRAKLSPEDNDKAAREFLKARTVVPSSAHPLAPRTGGVAQNTAGSQGHLHDKIIETVGDSDFVDVKYAHPKELELVGHK